MGKSNKRTDNLNSFFARYEKAALWIALACGALMSLFMFDTKVSLSGDDCDYIINAQQFIQHFTYPGGRGAMYPIVIAPFLLGGLHLVLLKALSAVFIMLSMWFTYKAFRNKIPAAVLFPVLLIVNLCPYIFFYACHTYSEPFFMLTQALYIYLFSKYFVKDENGELQIRSNWKKFVFLGLLFLAMGLTRTIGYAVMGAVILYFCSLKQWRNLVYAFAAGLAVFLLFALFKKIVWPDSGAPYSITMYMAKNFYNPEQGYEDLSGYLDRLIENSHIYLSGFFYKFMGLRSSQNEGLENMPLLTILTYLLYAVFLNVVYKRNKALFFAGIYVGVMNFASFVLLQTNWCQDRLVMIYYPLMLLFMIGGLYYSVLSIRRFNLKWLFPLCVAAIFVGTVIHARIKVNNNLPVLQQNMLGNDLYGLTPDWENFIKMCRWVDKNLPKDAVVASRKPSISYVYTGRDFAGVYNVPNETLNDILNDYNNTDRNEFVWVALSYTKQYTGINTFIQYYIIPRNGFQITINNVPVPSVLIMKIPASVFALSVKEFFDTNSANYTTDFDAILKQCEGTDAVKYSIINPDILFNYLKDNNIRYLLLPKIRTYTYHNTGQFINTVHQYISFISGKYPDAFKLINTIGKEETCELAEFTK